MSYLIYKLAKVGIILGIVILLAIIRVWVIGPLWFDKWWE